MKQLVNILIICIALVFTILGGQFIPKKYFESYVLELDSVWSKVPSDQEYLIDINDDSAPGLILHHNINKSGHSIEFRQNSRLHEIYIFRGNEVFIGKSLYFLDIREHRTKDLLFVSVKDNIAYLNILEYNPDKKLFLQAEKISIDSISLYDGKPDVTNNYIVTNGSEVFLDLQGGYSVQPRNVYKYNLENKTLIKTKRNSIVAPEIAHFNINQQDFLLAKYVRATGNTISHEEAESFKNSLNKDTLEIYESVKNLEYPYGDFSSYILLYNKELDFAFEPIEFFGWTNYSKSDIIHIDSIPYIVSLTNTEKGDDSVKSITICNLQGSIQQQISLPYNFSHLFTADDKLIFFGNKTLYEYSDKLEKIREIDKITTSYGFFDIDHKGEKEFIAFTDNVLKILSVDLKTIASFKIEQEFAPYPETNSISIVQMNAKTCFLFNTRLFYYLFSFNKNHYAFLKYPFYLFLFSFWFGLLLGIIKLNSRRLEKEKKRLEDTVNERTIALEEKNQELALQKTEILEQANELSQQNKHLEELDEFKRTLTGTIIHDLKNPLGQILYSSKNKAVNNLAKRMLLLITNMLDVDKYEQTEFKLNKELHSFNEIVKEAIDDLEVSMQEKNIDVKVNMEDIAVMADKELIVRVLENLLSNAVRFSPQNQNIEIDAYYTEFETVEISIKNYGENIPDEAIESIFDKYIQAHKIESSSYKSTGLGLTFCKMVLQAHNQNIKAENLDGGVLFRFSLDGRRLSPQKIISSTNFSPIELTLTEKEILRPWLEQLMTFEIYQISDIIEILDQIPNSSENIIALKQQITNAVFASNAELYSQIIC